MWAAVKRIWGTNPNFPDETPVYAATGAQRKGFALVFFETISPKVEVTKIKKCPKE